MCAGRFDRHPSMVTRAPPAPTVPSSPTQPLAACPWPRNPSAAPLWAFSPCSVGVQGPSPVLECHLGFSLTLKSMCNLHSTCGSLSCHQDLLLSLPCSACWAQVLWGCALVLSIILCYGHHFLFQRMCHCLLSLSCWWCAQGL